MPKPLIRPAVPEPTMDPGGMLAAIKALKEAVEILQGQRSGMVHAAVRWQDLVDKGLVAQADVPKR